MALTPVVPVDPAPTQLGATEEADDGVETLAWALPACEAEAGVDVETLALALPAREAEARRDEESIETLTLALPDKKAQEPASFLATAGAIQLYEPGVLVIAAQGQEGSARAPLGAIKPYCGAPHTLAVRAEDTRVGALELHGYPIPAWSDVGMASHLRGLGDLADGGQRKKDKIPEVLRPSFDARVFIFRVLLVVVSLAENICCWLTYLEIRNADRRFYNKFEAYALGLPGLDSALAAVAVLNTLYLFATWVAVGVVKMDICRTLAISRLLLSAAMAVICFIAIFFAEGTKVSPFACTLTSMIQVQVVFYGGLLPHRGEEPSARRRRLCHIGVCVFAVLGVAWLLLFLLDGMAFLREDACRATKNRAMPVRLQGLNHWQCAIWGSKHYIERLPASGAELVQAWCDTSFHQLDQSEVVCRLGQDLAPGAKHLTDSGKAAGSDLECNRRCQSAAGCTSWVRQVGDAGKCWLTTQIGEISWIRRATRNSGTPGCIEAEAWPIDLRWRPSQGAHYVQCPPNCQSHGLGLEVVGCQVYDSRSPICSAAVQSGLVNAETGGLVKVVGRPPPAEYDMCHLRGVLSVKEVDGLPGSAVLATRASRNATTLLGAFYFQEVGGMNEHDVVTLHGFKQTSTPGPKRPYESYVADVSWRIGGGEVQREEIRLGPAAEGAAIELNFCHGAGSAPNDCE